MCVVCCSMASRQTVMRLEKRLTQATECPICADVFVNPKLLQCGHTVCLQCLQQIIRGKLRGDEVRCPICRTIFSIPKGRVEKLPTNYAVVGLLEESDGLPSSVRSCRLPINRNKAARKLSNKTSKSQPENPAPRAT